MGGATWTGQQLETRIRTVNAGAAGANDAYDAGDPALNANATIDTGVPFRGRFTIVETGGGMANNTFVLRRSLNGGAYTDVPTTGGPVNVQDSSGFVDDDATTQLISTGTFVAGACDDLDNVCPTAGNIAIQSNRTEIDFCLQLDAANVSQGDTLDFRVYVSGGTPLATYTVTPRATANVAAGPQEKTILPVTETDTAQVLSVTKTIFKTLAPVTETDAAQALSFSQAGGQDVTLVPVVEGDSALVLSFTKTVFKDITAITESDTAQAVSLAATGAPHEFIFVFV